MGNFKERLGLNASRITTIVGLGLLATGVATSLGNNTAREVTLHWETIDSYAATHDVPAADYFYVGLGELTTAAGFSIGLAQLSALAYGRITSRLAARAAKDYLAAARPLEACAAPAPPEDGAVADEPPRPMAVEEYCEQVEPLPRGIPLAPTAEVWSTNNRYGQLPPA